MQQQFLHRSLLEVVVVAASFLEEVVVGVEIHPCLTEAEEEVVGHPYKEVVVEEAAFPPFLEEEVVVVEAAAFPPFLEEEAVVEVKPPYQEVVEEVVVAALEEMLKHLEAEEGEMEIHPCQEEVVVVELRPP